MNNTTAYTPLESLLLFQSLYSWGTESITFSRISEALKNHELINQAPTYDPGRLSSDALRELYSQWVREELEGESREDGECPTKKRKLHSPTLASNEDRNEHLEKLARLVEKSYAWYSKSIVRDIREDERIYALLQREIQEIESQEIEKPLRDGPVDSGRHGSASSIPTDGGVVQRTTSSGEFAQPERLIEGASGRGSIQTREIRRQPSDPSPPAPSPSSRSDGFAISDLVNGPTPSGTNHRESISHSRNGSQSSQGAYQYPTGAPRPSPLQPVPQGLAGSQNYNNWPHQGGPSPLQPYSHQGPSYSPQYPPPFSPGQHPPRGSFSGPTGISSHHTPLPSSPLTTSGRNSAIQLPPPIPLQHSRSSTSPAGSLDALADIAGQQNHIPASPHPQQAVQNFGTYGQPLSNYNPEGRPPSGNSHPAPLLNHSSNHVHLPLPLPVYSPQQQQQQAASFAYPPRPIENPLVAGQSASSQYNSPYNGSQNVPILGSAIPNRLSRVAPLTTPSRPSLDSRLPLSTIPHTPIFNTPPVRPINSTGKLGTRWKALDSLPQEFTPKFTGTRLPKRPIPEPLSPVLAKATLPVPPTPQASAESEKSAATSVKKIADKPLRNEPAKRGRPRAESAASSIPDSTRSQSEMSRADELSLDNGVSGRRVKQEVATPRIPIDEEAEEDDDAPLPAQPGPRSDQLMEEAEPSRQSNKRKRADSPTPPPRKPPGPATHVTWTRNFSKICASALDSIGGHRNASTFSAPVKDRDAPQYSSLIKYPQDLKSIRTAINVGTRAAASAATAAGIDPTQTTVKLPITDDIVPPHGIINNQQLEKELAHMFANAVMYNPSPKGFVPWFKNKISKKEEAVGNAGENYEVEEFAVFNETKLMSRDVDKIFGELRAAERPRLGDEISGRGGDGSVGLDDDQDDEVVDEMVGDGDGVGGRGVKRRRAG